jgi:hypothetical protein
MTSFTETTSDTSAVEALLDLHDVDSGVVVMSARPERIGPRHALLDVLGALGKTASLCGPPSETSTATAIVVQWLIAEQISSVTVLGANRWPIRAERAVEAAVVGAGAQFIPIRDLATCADVSLVGRRIASATRTKAATCPTEWQQIRRLRLPHVAAATLASELKLSWSDLMSTTVEDVTDGGHQLRLLDWVLTVPDGAGRFLRVQELHSRHHGQRMLFSLFGRPLRRDEFAHAALKGQAEAEL